MRERGRLAKRAVATIYSHAAANLYEPIVVRRAFPFLGGDLNEAVLEQGRRAGEAAATRPVLDMPVGTAHFTLGMALAHAGIVVGADIAAGMVREAARKAEEAQAGNLLIVQADAHRLPFVDGAFGAVVCANGLQVIPGLEPTLGELTRVLVAGGRLYASVVRLPVGALLPKAADRRLPALLKSEASLTEAFEHAGLRIVTVRRQRLALLLEAVKP